VGCLDAKVKANTLSGLKYLFLTLYALLTFFPLWWTFSNSFRTNSQIFTQTRLIPESFTFINNYMNIFKQKIPRARWNSFSITTVALVLLIVCSVPAAYLMAQYRFKFAAWIFGLFSAGVIVPRMSILIATFSNFQKMGFLQKQYPITLCYAAFELPISVFLMVGFMQTIPASVLESGKIDGCNSFSLLMRLVLPMSRNGIVTVLILAFVSVWNEFAYASILIPNIKFKTMTIVLANAKNEYITDYGMMAAGVIVAVLPMIVVYSFLQEKIVSGMVAGAVKG
jgi:raffinose/stachyose/melibiose transport system permease protein